MTSGPHSLWTIAAYCCLSDNLAKVKYYARRLAPRQCLVKVCRTDTGFNYIWLCICLMKKHIAFSTRLWYFSRYFSAYCMSFCYKPGHNACPSQYTPTSSPDTFQSILAVPSNAAFWSTRTETSNPLSSHRAPTYGGLYRNNIML